MESESELDDGKILHGTENDQDDCSAFKKPRIKVGRRLTWSADQLDDLVDIVVNNEYYKKKLIFENTKKQKMDRFMRKF